MQRYSGKDAVPVNVNAMLGFSGEGWSVAYRKWCQVQDGSRISRRQYVGALGVFGLGLGPVRAVAEGSERDTAGLTNRSVQDLLALQVGILHELRQRNVIRSANTLTGDYAETLFCAAFNWDRAAASAAGYDATDAAGQRFQIKARRQTGGPGGRQLSALRRLAERPFDTLAAVLFEPDYRVFRAALIPYDVVLRSARFSAHTNSHRFHLRDGVWSVAGVRDVTARLDRAAVQLG